MATRCCQQPGAHAPRWWGRGAAGGVMAWVRLDDGFTEHPKIAQVGAFGAWLQIQALCYANRNLTDGFVPWGVARGFVARGTHRLAGDRAWKLGETCGTSGQDVGEVDWPALMIDAALWEALPGGYRIHDYEDYQPTKADVLAERAAWGKRQERSRMSRRESRRDSRVESRSESRRESRPCHARPVPVPVPVPEEKKKNEEDTARGCRVPEGPLPPEWRAYATKLRLDADAVYEEFLDYWRGIPGSRGRKVGSGGWYGAWRNRCRDVAGRPKRNGHAPPLRDAETKPKARPWLKAPPPAEQPIALRDCLPVGLRRKVEGGQS